MLGLGASDAGVLAALGRQHLLTLLSALLAVPVAWAATRSRGLLPGIGLIVTTQVMVVAGTGVWFPLAAPALWAMEPIAVTPFQLTLTVTIPLIFAPATLHTWRQPQLDR